MQVLHFVVATAAVFIFLYFARLPRLHKLLYAFGFFPMYQYAIISRCYAPGLLLMMGYCALVTTGRHGGLPGAVVLALLANASAFGWLLAVALKHIPLGTGYVIWVGIGAVGTALLGISMLAGWVRTAQADSPRISTVRSLRSTRVIMR